jgi:uncharacterized protein YicC (UPF0701 family)
MDDDTRAILVAHAGALAALADGQATLAGTQQTIAQTQQAVLGLLERQHAEGNATSTALQTLVQGIRQAQASAEQHRQAAAQRLAEVRDLMAASSRPGVPAP